MSLPSLDHLAAKVGEQLSIAPTEITRDHGRGRLPKTLGRARATFILLCREWLDLNQSDLAVLLNTTQAAVSYTLRTKRGDPITLEIVQSVNKELRDEGFSNRESEPRLPQQD